MLYLGTEYGASDSPAPVSRVVNARNHKGTGMSLVQVSIIRIGLKLYNSVAEFVFLE